MFQIDLQSIDLLDPSVRETLMQLADELKRQPAFVAMARAHDEFQADQHTQDLLAKARARQNQLRFSWTDEDKAELDQLVDELSQTPSVIAYNQAEQELRELFRAVDAVISEAVGVGFAANARRSCCGG